MISFKKLYILIIFLNIFFTERFWTDEYNYYFKEASEKKAQGKKTKR